MIVDPKPGDWFVVRTDGTIAKLIRWVTQSSVNHAGVYIGNGQIVEARFSGAGYASVSKYNNALWSTDNLPARLTPTDIQRDAIAKEAIRLVGTKYGAIDIVAIGFAQRKLGSFVKSDLPLAKQPWYIKRLARSDRLICSQLVDLVLDRSGIHLYNDDRPTGLVSPENLREFLIKNI